MKHWKKTLPKFIIDIKYEDLVNNPKEQIYELLKRCNLEWDPNCLDFYNNKRISYCKFQLSFSSKSTRFNRPQ